MLEVLAAALWCCNGMLEWCNTTHQHHPPYNSNNGQNGSLETQSGSVSPQYEEILLTWGLSCQVCTPVHSSLITMTVHY